MIESIKKEVTIQFSRSAGPGGQNVNKLNTRATAKWNLSKSELLDEDSLARFRTLFGSKINKLDEVVVSSECTRHQIRNYEDCLKKLISMIEEARVVPKKRKASKPSRSAVAKAITNQKRSVMKRKNRMKVVV